MDSQKKNEIKQRVKKTYGAIFNSSGLNPSGLNSSGSNSPDLSSSGCCGDAPLSGCDHGKQLNYSEQDLLCAGDAPMPLLGCGNPVGEAGIVPGETVVDLGCGAGFDAFLSAKKTTKTGRVVGIDMTPEMIDKAKSNAARLGAENVDFRLGEIEKLPVSDGVADLVMSNCVINLSTDKRAVFREIYRILKPGGRISISDIFKSGDMPKEIMDHPAAYTGWVSGAISSDEARQILGDVGFEDVSIEKKDNSREIIQGWKVCDGAEDVVFSAYIKAVKPLG